MRRARLREWVNANGVPQKEKSYFSQLFSGVASFGEKAARRLESDYGMGQHYLDGGSTSQPQPRISSVASSPNLAQGAIDGDQIVELVLLFQQASESGREFILSSARSAAKASPSRWRKIGNNES